MLALNTSQVAMLWNDTNTGMVHRFGSATQNSSLLSIASVS
jgi:hypothetical protein